MAEPRSAAVFNSMKMEEIREWLVKHDVKFSPKARPSIFSLKKMAVDKLKQLKREKLLKASTAGEQHLRMLRNQQQRGSRETSPVSVPEHDYAFIQEGNQSVVKFDDEDDLPDVESVSIEQDDQDLPSELLTTKSQPSYSVHQWADHLAPRSASSPVSPRQSGFHSSKRNSVPIFYSSSDSISIPSKPAPQSWIIPTDCEEEEPQHPLSSTLRASYQPISSETPGMNWAEPHPLTPNPSGRRRSSPPGLGTFSSYHQEMEALPSNLPHIEELPEEYPIGDAAHEQSSTTICGQDMAWAWSPKTSPTASSESDVAASLGTTLEWPADAPTTSRGPGTSSLELHNSKGSEPLPRAHTPSSPTPCTHCSLQRVLSFGSTIDNGTSSSHELNIPPSLDLAQPNASLLFEGPLSGSLASSDRAPSHTLPNPNKDFGEPSLKTQMPSLPALNEISSSARSLLKLHPINESLAESSTYKLNVATNPMLGWTGTLADNNVSNQSTSRNIQVPSVPQTNSSKETPYDALHTLASFNSFRRTLPAYQGIGRKETQSIRELYGYKVKGPSSSSSTSIKSGVNESDLCPQAPSGPKNPKNLATEDSLLDIAPSNASSPRKVGVKFVNNNVYNSTNANNDKRLSSSSIREREGTSNSARCTKRLHEIKAMPKLMKKLNNLAKRGDAVYQETLAIKSVIGVGSDHPKKLKMSQGRRSLDEEVKSTYKDECSLESSEESNNSAPQDSSQSHGRYKHNKQRRCPSCTQILHTISVLILLFYVFVVTTYNIQVDMYERSTRGLFT